MFVRSFICVPEDKWKQCGRIRIICLWDAKTDQPFTANDKLWIYQRVLPDSVVHLKTLRRLSTHGVFVITSAKEVKFSSALVCLLVSKVTQKHLSQKFGGELAHGPRKDRLDFGVNPDLHPHPVIFSGILPLSHGHTPDG